MVEPFVEHYGLRLSDPPFETDDFAFSCVWRGRSDGDPGLAWLVATLKSIAQHLP